MSCKEHANLATAIVLINGHVQHNFNMREE